MCTPIVAVGTGLVIWDLLDGSNPQKCVEPVETIQEQRVRLMEDTGYGFEKEEDPNAFRDRQKAFEDFRRRPIGK